jgi:hypothetical protein
MQWKEEREATLSSGHGQVEAYARALVAGACRGDAYVKRPNWYDVFLVFRVFAPDVLSHPISGGKPDASHMCARI